MALVSDIQLQSSAVKPPNLDTSQKFSAEGLTATTAFSVTDAGAGTTVTPLGLVTAQSANDISAYFNTTNTDGDINLYLNNDANPYWNLKLSGTASDSFMITNACGGPAGGTAAEKTALSITPVGAVGIGKASASNALDISYQNSSSGGVVITEATNSIATKIISESSSGSIGTTTNSKFGFRTNSATVAAFDTSGNFGIGTDAPGATLDVRGGAIFNEAGAAVDFRIEGDTCANLFFIDGSADRVGIGTATPAVLLDVDNGGATSQLLMCVNGCICAQGYMGEKQGHVMESSEVVFTQRAALNFVLTDVGCLVDDSSNDATVVCINGANTCVPFLMADGSTSDPISLAGGSIGNKLSNDSNPTLGGLMCGGGNNICAVCCICVTGCYFGNGSQLTGVSSVPSSFSGDCTIIGCDAGGNVAGGAEKVTLYGANAGYNATTPGNIVVIGESAGLCMTTAQDVVLVGTGSGRCVLTCAGNLALGAWSLYNECAGTNNTVVGTCAGHAQKGATTNTFVGSHAGVAASTGSGNVFIGYRAGCACTTQSNRLYIGNGTPILVGDITCGLVGIGTTSVVTHAADTSVLQIGGNAVLWGNKAVGASKSLQISQNAYYDEDTTWQYVSTDEASNYYQDSGTHAFRYAASGSAGADITWSTALTISNAGLVGIGTAPAGHTLQVTAANGGASVNLGDCTVTNYGNQGQYINIGSPTGGGDGWQIGKNTNADNTVGPSKGFYFYNMLCSEAAAVIDVNSNVGIGTTLPDSLLHVFSGDSTNTPSTSADDLHIEGTSSVGMTISSSTTGYGLIYFADSGSDSSGYLSYYHNNDSLSIGTATTERIRIDSSGRVGIATTAPAQLLHLQGAASAPELLIEDTGNNTATLTLDGDRTTVDTETGKIFFAWNNNDIAKVAGLAGPDTTNKDDGQLSFQTAAPGGTITEAMRIDESQNVGIGTGAPAQTLDVCGTGRFGGAAVKLITYSDTSYSGFYNGSSISSDESIYIGNDRMYMYVAGAPVFHFNSCNLAVGTAPSSAAPDADPWNWGTQSFSVLSGSTNADTNIDIGATGTGTAGLLFGGGTVSGTCQAILRASITVNDGSSMYFNTNTTDSGTSTPTKMAITAAGNVGIGTAAPDGKMHIFTAQSPATVNASNDELIIEGHTNIGMSFLTCTNGAARITWGDGSGTDAYSGQIAYYHDGDYMNFLTGSTERMRISSAGKVGIGTAPTETLSLYTSNCTTCFTMISNGNADVPGIKFCSGAAVQPLYSICGCWGSGSIFQDAHCGMAHVFQTCAVQRLLITSNGCMAVGNTVPQGLFHIFAATAGTHTPNPLADQLVIEDNTNAGMTIVVPDDAYAQIVMGSPGADGSYCSNARLAGGYNSGNQRFDISVGGCDSAMTVYDTGCVNIGGVLSKGSGSFRIQHPLESRDGYDLVHSFTESPQADLLYSGWTKLTSGITTINIDTIHDMTEGTFVALNRCIRVFTSNESDWDTVRGSVAGNQLTIESNNSSSVACVSWLVIGERCDKHMFDTDWTDDNGRVIVEPETAPPLVIEE